MHVHVSTGGQSFCLCRYVLLWYMFQSNVLDYFHYLQFACSNFEIFYVRRRYKCLKAVLLDFTIL